MSTHPWIQALQKEVSLKQLLLLLAAMLAGLWRARLQLFVLLLAGAIGGAAYSWLRPVKYKAGLVLAAEEEKPAAYEGLAAQFGLDLGSGGGSSIFHGESLVRLFTTRQMLKRTLLMPMDKELLADKLFATTSHAKKEVFQGFRFTIAGSSSLQDSAIRLLQKELTEKVLTVVKPDKKQAIIEVYAIHVNPILAKQLVDELVRTVSDYYIETVTYKSRRNLEILQSEYDSIQLVLNTELMRSANAYDLNVNPSREALRVAGNRAMIDAEIATKIFAEITKNLKLAEINLRKQTPLIQVIDPVSFPLEKVGLKRLYCILLGMALGFGVAIARLYWSEHA